MSMIRLALALAIMGLFLVGCPMPGYGPWYNYDDETICRRVVEPFGRTTVQCTNTWTHTDTTPPHDKGKLSP